MNGDGNFSELFDRYLEGELNFHEKKEFETRVQEDPVLAELFRLHKEVDYSLIEEEILNFREKLWKIQVENTDLVTAGPMVFSSAVEEVQEQTTIEDDLAVLREQLNTIHSSFVGQELSDPTPQYPGNELGRLNSEVDLAIMQEEVVSLRGKLNEIGARVTEVRKPAFKRKKVKRLSVAAAVITWMIITGSTLAYFSSGWLGNKATLKNYFGPYSGLNEHRGQNQSDSEVFKAGLDKYNQGNYPGAFEMMELAINGGNDSDLAVLYTGISALQSGFPEKAEKYLLRLNNEAIVIEQAEWYLAGSRIALKKLDAAMALLRKIKETPGHFYADQASLLLKKLEKR